MIGKDANVAGRALFSEGNLFIAYSHEDRI